VAIGVAVALAVLLLATGAAAAGWYALGIKVGIETDPAESKIVIDGQEVGKTNNYGSLTTSRLRTGDHTLIVTRDGFDEWKQSFNIAFTDLSKSLNIKLNATKYKLTVVSSPAGSEVLVDSNSLGTTNDSSGNLETAPLAPGDHLVIVRHDGYREWKQTVKLSADQKVDVTLSSAPVTDTSGSADSEIRNALEGWAQTSRNRDIDGHLRYYADTLDFYYNRTMVPSAKIREDRTKAFAKFTSISIQLTNMDVQVDSTGQRATVTLDKAFDFRGDNNAFWNGSVQDQLALTKLGGAWLITGEKELKVYFVNK
jgi:ketosteroid isomerase-like protein